MALGQRADTRQQELWIAAEDLAAAPRNVFYERLNRVLAKAGFDRWVEDLCRPYYADDGRDSIPPGIYFRMLLIGYFENIDSQRGIAWRCADSLSLKVFLGYNLADETPDHSSLTKIRGRLPEEVFRRVFHFMLRLVDEHKLLGATVVGVDSTTLEANAAMKAIVRKDSGEDWNEYVTRLMREQGVISAEATPNAEEIRRFDKQRKDKKVSNEEWHSPHDPDAKITKMKDSRTHLAYKAEHVVDLNSEVILAAEVYTADQADTATLTCSLEAAQANVDATDSPRAIEKAAADKGYHAAETIVNCGELGVLGVKTYIPEPHSPHGRRWTDKPAEQQRAVYANRRRTQSEYGKGLQRRRSEVVERSFAHLCDTGGGRRTLVRGIENVRKKHMILAAAHNLGLILRKLLGAGKPKALADLLDLLRAACLALFTIPGVLRNLWRSGTTHQRDLARAA